MKPHFFLLAVLVLVLAGTRAAAAPRVFVFTDINIDQGDPDDRQSLVHLLWYGDELQIEGIVPDRWNAGGYRACMLALDAYARDFERDGFPAREFPAPEALRARVATDPAHAERLFVEAASAGEGPLWVLVWGNMEQFGEILRAHPDLADNLRLITIGTGLMLESGRAYLPASWEKTEKPCEQPNWNAQGRDEIFADPRFRDLWWLEMNWTYAGMFPGDEPARMLEKLSVFGALGRHLKEVVANEEWAQYFRVGDTPSVLYVIDPGHDLGDPTEPSWAGRFKRPFPKERPHYYADHNGPVPWDYADPCRTWEHHEAMDAHAQSTLLEQRPEMYAALLSKLRSLYPDANP